jgi:hypothetical protein
MPGGKNFPKKGNLFPDPKGGPAMLFFAVSMAGIKNSTNRLTCQRARRGNVRDAAVYITKLPKAKHDADEWQAAMVALLLVAEHDGPTMFARIGILRALNGHVERVFDRTHKETD